MGTIYQNVTKHTSYLLGNFSGCVLLYSCLFRFVESLLVGTALTAQLGFVLGTFLLCASILAILLACALWLLF